jgi:hypothetical protein
MPGRRRTDETEDSATGPNPVESDGEEAAEDVGCEDTEALER